MAFIANMKSTSAQLEKLRQVFLTLDVNNDGKLSFEEIRSGIDSFSEVSPRFSKPDYLALMESVDKDHNKYIDYQEFIAAASDHAQLLSKANLQAAFRVFDSDGSGQLSVDELRQVFDTSGRRKDQSLWQEIMLEADINRDGNISFEEFVESMGV